MKRVLFIHFSFLVSFFILLSLANSWLSLSYWPLWLGGIVGSILPELDSLVYVFFVNPQELTSQRVIYLLKKRSFLDAVRLLIETRLERGSLVFHSNTFLVTALVLGIWLMTSSASYLGKGIVLGIIVHLVVDRLNLRLYHKA